MYYRNDPSEYLRPSLWKTVQFCCLGCLAFKILFSATFSSAVNCVKKKLDYFNINTCLLHIKIKTSEYAHYSAT